MLSSNRKRLTCLLWWGYAAQANVTKHRDATIGQSFHVMSPARDGSRQAVFEALIGWVEYENQTGRASPER